MQKNFCPIYKKYFLLLANPHIFFFSFIFHNHFLNSITTTSTIPHSNPISQKKPLLFLCSPPSLRSNTAPLLSRHATSEPPIIPLHPSFSAYLPMQPVSLPSLTIPINSDIPTYTTNQKPFPLNSFVVIPLY